jgi:hypothetical protein
MEGEIVIELSTEIVFDFVADERNEPRYNPHMVRAELISGEPIGEGTKFRALTKSMGRRLEVTIEFTRYERPTLLESATQMSSADIRGVLTFEPVAAGTRMRWSWEVEPHGLFKLMAPIVTRIGPRQEATIWANLKRYLEASGTAAPQ